jgi:hypothetical protein
MGWSIPAECQQILHMKSHKELQKKKKSHACAPSSAIVILQKLGTAWS